MYVDLNPIHAGEAMVPEEARYTSAYHRIQGLQQRAQSANADGRCDQSPEASPSMPADGWLCELTVVESPPADVRQGLQSQTPWRASDKGLLPISLQNYLSLLDWTGRQLAGTNGERFRPIWQAYSSVWAFDRRISWTACGILTSGLGP